MKITKYGSSWCGPCRMATETLEKSGLPFEDIDIDNNPEAVADLRIRRIPHIVFKDEDDNVLYTHIGSLTSSELNSIVEKYG